MRYFTAIGIIGIAIFVALNAFAVLVLEKASAQPFSSEWWSQWFPSGVVWLVFLTIGAARWLFKRFSSKRKTNACS